jgi:2'-5' RNA ligase
VTVLPPRPLHGQAEAGENQILRALPDFGSFRIELAEVALFPGTQVVYLELAMGGGELHQMHDALNRSNLHFNEPYEYHPHVTLAQELPEGNVQWAFDLARERWAEFRHSRGFTLDTLTYVQNTDQKLWIDLREFSLVSPLASVSH